MAKQYELFDDEKAFSEEEMQDITDELQDSDEPDTIKESIASLARSVPKIPQKGSIIPPEMSVKNYHKADQMGIILDRFQQYGINIDGMTNQQIYGKYFSEFEPDKYHKK